ncbi:MAG: hypothetical protein NVS2B9_12050 [Myxococcales bacterium]
MIDHSRMTLGKKPARHDPRTLQLGNYLKPAGLPAPKPSVDWGRTVQQWPMMANDKVGDCTCAAAGHLIEEWTANAAGQPVVLPDAEILSAYSAITGYTPTDPSTDRGANELDVLNYWRKTGFNGRRIVAYAALEPKNRTHVEDAVDLFGGCYIGRALPVSAQKQAVWAVPPGGPTGTGAPGSWGGHAVPVVAYDPRGLTVVTWGATKRMTWDFWNAYCDEAYAAVSEDWIGKNKVSPEGFDLKALLADLQQVAIN